MAIDFARHNEEVVRLWESYRTRRPWRVPVTVTFGFLYFVESPEFNTKGVTFEQTFDDPEVQFNFQMDVQRWRRFNVPMDAEMGLPTKEWAGPSVDFENVFDAAWFGAPIQFIPGSSPDARVAWSKERLRDTPRPDPLKTYPMNRGYEFYQYFEEKRRSLEIDGRPIGKIGSRLAGTDGPFTVACDLRGTTNMCTDLYEDPEFAHWLLGFITDATIERIRDWRDLMGLETPAQEWFAADDDIALLSPATYREFVYPCHKRLFDAFSKGGPNSYHLCGAALQHFRTLRDEFNVQAFETGFAVDPGKARREVGPDVELRGTVHPEIIARGSAAEIGAEVSRVLRSGVTEGRRFILQDGTRIAVGTSLEQMRLFYEAGRELGVYPEGD